MSSDDERERRKLLRSWAKASLLIRVSLKYIDVRSPRIILVCIEFDNEADVLIMRADDGTEIKLDLSSAHFAEAVSSEGMTAIGLNSKMYSESLRITSDLLACDLFTIPEVEMGSN
jgi:hypothetical protein